MTTGRPGARRRVTPPIELLGPADQPIRWAPVPPLDPQALNELRAVAAVVTVDDDPAAVAEASRDWWPLAVHWSLDGQVAQLAAAVVRPSTTAEVAAVITVCARHHIPVTPTGGRSSVTGGAVPAFGGIALDLTELRGIVELDAESGVVGVRAGTFGADLDDELAGHGLTVGHLPQSHELATVGGWIACRGAGQFSNRYGKIEDIVVELEVVLADGSIVRTGGAPAAAVGPDLTQLFVGSEGVLGVVTTAWLRAHPRASVSRQAALRFAAFDAALDACRRITQAGVAPAVLRLYDGVESTWSQRGGDGTSCLLLLLDEGHDEAVVEARMAAAVAECAAAEPAGAELVDAWWQHRNDTSGLQALTRKGLVVDTMEVAGRWAQLPAVLTSVTTAVDAVAGARSVSCHLSHSYPDGACLYFTFVGDPGAAHTIAAGAPDDSERSGDPIESLYVAIWDAAQRAALEAGANLSHHHGVGLARGRFVAEALGPAFQVLVALKHALDPAGILNPGKLGLPSDFGPPPWPPTPPRPASRPASPGPAGTP